MLANIPVPEAPLLMLIDQLTSIFCFLDDACKVIEPTLDHFSLPATARHYLTRRPELSCSEIATILVAFHLSNYRTFKRYYIEVVRELLRAEFPGAPSYNRFIELIPRNLVVLASVLPRLFGEVTGISYIDSTPLVVCDNHRIHSHKVFKDIARRGKTSMGWFFGLKLHIVINERGELLCVKVTPGNVSDSKPVCAMATKLIGILFGDKGYISKKNEEALAKIGVKLITKKRKNMKPQKLSREESRLLRKRGIVETVIDQLKNICQIDHTRHRSPINAMVHLLAGLIAYCFLPEKPQISSPKDASTIVKPIKSWA